MTKLTLTSPPFFFTSYSSKCRCHRWLQPRRLVRLTEALMKCVSRRGDFMHIWWKRHWKSRAIPDIAYLFVASDGSGEDLKGGTWLLQRQVMMNAFQVIEILLKILVLGHYGVHQWTLSFRNLDQKNKIQKRLSWMKWIRVCTRAQPNRQSGQEWEITRVKTRPLMW